MHCSPTRLIGTLSVFLLGLICASGCGPGIKDRGVVKGKVTIGGKALNMGTVQFVTDDNRSGTAMIKEDGTYEMPDAPVGECKIAVVVVPASGGKMGPGAMMPPGGKMPGAPAGPNMAPGTKGTPKPPEAGTGGGDGMQMKAPPPPLDPSKAVKIPERYSSPETSGLTYKVSRGEQTHDIPLTP